MSFKENHSIDKQNQLQKDLSKKNVLQTNKFR